MRSITKTVSPALTAAQVNALDSTPINIIPAPPAGYMIAVDDFICSKLSGTAVGSCTTQPIGLVYTGDTSLIWGLDAAGAVTNSNALIATGTTAATYITARGLPLAVAEAGSVITGNGVDISAPGSTIGSFDGTMQVTVTFRIVKIG